MDDKKKKFTIPEAEIFDFEGEDIITGSGNDDWGLDDNHEGFPGFDPEN